MHLRGWICLIGIAALASTAGVSIAGRGGAARHARVVADLGDAAVQVPVVVDSFQIGSGIGGYPNPTVYEFEAQVQGALLGYLTVTFPDTSSFGVPCDDDGHECVYKETFLSKSKMDTAFPAGNYTFYVTGFGDPVLQPDLNIPDAPKAWPRFTKPADNGSLPVNSVEVCWDLVERDGETCVSSPDDCGDGVLVAIAPTDSEDGEDGDFAGKQEDLTNPCYIIPSDRVTVGTEYILEAAIFTGQIDLDAISPEINHSYGLSPEPIVFTVPEPSSHVALLAGAAILFALQRLGSRG